MEDEKDGEREPAGLTLLESLGALLQAFPREQRAQSMAADPGGFARAFNIEKRLGLVVSPGRIPESVLREHGLGGVLRMPAFEGQVLIYQTLNSPMP
ncbi:hypothetical protein ACN47A_36055 [Myxococcus fulvus]|uniref:hypothetical protein n=1 Tax=Myxococcus fulvus TaxID=33 RepID=UPI003B9B8699